MTLLGIVETRIVLFSVKVCLEDSVPLSVFSELFFPNPAFIFLENSVSIKSSIGNSIVSFKIKCGTYIWNCFSCIII